MIIRYLVSPLSQCTVVYCVVAELVKRYYFNYLVGWRKHWLFVAIRYISNHPLTYTQTHSVNVCLCVCECVIDHVLVLLDAFT